MRSRRCVELVLFCSSYDPQTETFAMLAENVHAETVRGIHSEERRANRRVKRIFESDLSRGFRRLDSTCITYPLTNWIFWTCRLCECEVQTTKRHWTSLLKPHGKDMITHIVLYIVRQAQQQQQQHIVR